MIERCFDNNSIFLYSWRMIFKCYIDETGDEGIGTGGSRWFIVGVLIVSEEAEGENIEMVKDIKKRLGVEILHWKKLKRHDQKRFVCQQLLTKPWEFCCIATDKNHPNITNAPNMKLKDQLYCYTVKLLFERLSWYARDHGNNKAFPIFEYRSSTSYPDMKAYINKLSCWIPADAVQISWNNIDLRFKLLPKDKSALLQATDCVAGAMKDGLEYSKLSLIEPSYALSLKERFYRRRGRLFSYGVKFLHIKPKDISQVLNEYTWLKQLEQAPERRSP